MIFHLNLSVWAAGRTTIEVITMSCLILRRVGGKARVRDADASRRRWPYPSASRKKKKKKKQN